MKKSWLLLLLVLLAVMVVPALNPAQASATTLKVFAAASLDKAFPAEAKGFKAAWPRYKNVKFAFNFLGTDVLVAQISSEPTAADVFAGASTAYGDTLVNQDGTTLDPDQALREVLPEQALRHPAEGQPRGHRQPRRRGQKSDADRRRPGRGTDRQVHQHRAHQHHQRALSTARRTRRRSWQSRSTSRTSRHDVWWRSAGVDAGFVYNSDSK